MSEYDYSQAESAKRRQTIAVSLSIVAMVLAFCGRVTLWNEFDNKTEYRIRRE